MLILLQRSNMNFFGNIIERPTGSVRRLSDKPFIFLWIACFRALSNGWTALMYAKNRNHGSTVEKLISLGADIEAKDK